MTDSVLYETPGPRARRRSRLWSIAVSTVLALVLAWVIVRLALAGQFTVDKWGPIIDPTDGTFLPLWRLMGLALVNTLTAAALAMAFSLVVGTALALTRITGAAWYRWIVVGAVELLRGVPVVIAIFFAYRVLPEIGLDLPALWFLVIGLTAYNSVIIAEIIRAGVLAVPRGQSEAASALGMRRGQVLRSILLPQAFRAMLPALISQLVVIVKDTSLAFIISYPETLRQAQIIIQSLHNPIPMYLTVAALFIAINYALTRLAAHVERRLSRSRSTRTAERDLEPTGS
ncbi:amino acid ABC transporter permease [Bounagaea algeriensis]